MKCIEAMRYNFNCATYSILKFRKRTMEEQEAKVGNQYSINNETNILR